MSQERRTRHTPREDGLIGTDAAAAESTYYSPNSAACYEARSELGQDLSPLSVIATVCSKWAEGRPSLVTTVHPSESCLVSCLPRFIMGSIAITHLPKVGPVPAFP
jgi:hypothetical protein